MTETKSSAPRKSLWIRARPYVILLATVLGLEFAVSYWFDWSLFHVTEIELSRLRDDGSCLRFTVNNLLQEERMLEDPSLTLLAVNADSVVRSRPIPLKLDGTSDDRVLLQPGDRLQLCASFASNMLKRDVVYEIQTFDEPAKAQCKFSVIVRKPSRSHAHLYGRVFNCADQLKILYEK